MTESRATSVAKGSPAEIDAPTERIDIGLSASNADVVIARLDFVAVLAAGLLSSFLQHLIASETRSSWIAILSIVTSAGLIYVLVAGSMGLYLVKSPACFSRSTRSIFLAWLVALLVLASLLSLFKVSGDVLRWSALTFAPTAALFLIGMGRLVGMELLRGIEDVTLASRCVLVVGTDSELERLTARQLLDAHGLHEVARLTIPDADEHRTQAADRAVVDQAIDKVRTSGVERILLALPCSDENRWRALIEQFQALPVGVVLLPDRRGGDYQQLSSRRIAGLEIELNRPPLSIGERLAKRLFDVTTAFVALVALLPLFLLIAALIRIDTRGPIIFRQDRIGFAGRSFSIYKFRTMSVMENGPVIRQASRNDARVTPIGRFLRRSSLDELPQLINVLRGDMSLVGPRPHALAHNREYKDAIAHYAFRHNVKPGVTGWAQINGLRGATPRLEMMERRVEHDLWYIANWSFRLDLRILALTCVEVLRPRSLE